MYAVKVLDWGHNGQESSAKHREAFEKEVAVWQKLDHPNVTKVHTASSEGRARALVHPAETSELSLLPLKPVCSSWARRWAPPS